MSYLRWQRRPGRRATVEAFFGGTADGTKLPHAGDWLTLRQLASTFAIRSEVSLADLRDDDYVHNDPEMIETLGPTGRRKATLEANEVREKKRHKTNRLTGRHVPTGLKRQADTLWKAE